MADTTTLTLTEEWDKTFPKSEQVNHRKVTFHNRYGITLAADLYEPRTPPDAWPQSRCAVRSARSRSRPRACTRRRWRSVDS